MDIIEGKTAELCACCCRLGAHYAGADAQVVDSMDRYGRSLGIAFQIVDDVLDLTGELALGRGLELNAASIRRLADLGAQRGDGVRWRVLVPSADKLAFARMLDA